MKIKILPPTPFVIAASVSLNEPNLFDKNVKSLNTELIIIVVSSNAGLLLLIFDWNNA